MCHIQTARWKRALPGACANIRYAAGPISYNSHTKMIRVTLARTSFSGAILVLCTCAALSAAASEALQKPAESLLEEGIKLTAARADATATSDIFARAAGRPRRSAAEAKIQSRYE